MSTQKTESAKTTKSAKAKQPTKGQSLTVQIEKYNKMHELVTRRARYQLVMDKLVSIDYAEQKDFFSEDYSSSIKWQLLDGRSIIFSISAPEILVEVQGFFLKKIQEQMNKIDAELLA